MPNYRQMSSQLSMSSITKLITVYARLHTAIRATLYTHTYVHAHAHLRVRLHVDLCVCARVCVCIDCDDDMYVTVLCVLIVFVPNVGSHCDMK